MPEQETDEDGAVGEMNQTISCLDSETCSLLELQLRSWVIHAGASVACNTLCTLSSADTFTFCLKLPSVLFHFW